MSFHWSKVVLYVPFSVLVFEVMTEVSNKYKKNRYLLTLFIKYFRF